MAKYLGKASRLDKKIKINGLIYEIGKNFFDNFHFLLHWLANMPGLGELFPENAQLHCQ